MFISNTGACAMMCPIAEAVLDEQEQQQSSQCAKPPITSIKEDKPAASEINQQAIVISMESTSQLVM